MKFFTLEYSRNKKITGKIEQVIEVKHNCHVSDNLNFIDRFPFEKIEMDKPILSTPILHEKAKRTDLINVGGIGFSFASIVISDKLKTILDGSNNYGVQFFRAKVIQGNVVYSNYWQTHIYKIPYEYIDFDKTRIEITDRDENRKLIRHHMEVSNKDVFLKLAESLTYPKMKYLRDVSFKDNMNLDYFFLRYMGDGHLGIVSEKLKNEIEDQKCSGLEFKPLELTFADWLQKGEREKIYGKA